jgi:hypothetical protein
MVDIAYIEFALSGVSTALRKDCITVLVACMGSTAKRMINIARKATKHRWHADMGLWVIDIISYLGGSVSKYIGKGDFDKTGHQYL